MRKTASRVRPERLRFMQNITALLVHHETQPFRALTHALKRLGMKPRRVRSLREAREVMAGAETPPLVFTDTHLPGGSWADIVTLAQNASAAVNVIVVARVVDVHLYMEALEAGAFDFIVPPFEAPGLEHVVRCAAESVLERRDAARRLAQAPQKALFPALASHLLAKMAGS